MDASSAFSRMSWYSSSTSFVPRIFSNTLRAYVKFEHQTNSMHSQLCQRHVQCGRLWCESLRTLSMEDGHRLCETVVSTVVYAVLPHMLWLRKQMQELCAADLLRVSPLAEGVKGVVQEDAAQQQCDCRHQAQPSDSRTNS